MTMTPDEIVRDFRNAKQPYKQIKILAELNGCGKDNIIDVLRAQGLSEDEIYAGKPGRKVIPGRKATELTESVQAEEEAFEQETVATERPDLSVAINVVKSRMSDLTDKLESLTRERERGWRRCIRRYRIASASPFLSSTAIKTCSTCSWI